MNRINRINNMENNFASGGGGEQKQRGVIQPGRVMALLKSASTTDEVVENIARNHGNVVNLHRPANNASIVFIQYDHPDTSEAAIESLRNYPIFKAIDHAYKSDGNKQQQQQQQHHGGSGRNQQHQKQHDAPPPMMNGGGSERQQAGGLFQDVPPLQPEIPLGCWHCTMLPNFECQCGAFYCNVICQRKDWPKHRENCIPRLVPISYSNMRMLQEATVGNRMGGSSSLSPFPLNVGGAGGGNNYINPQQVQPQHLQMQQQQLQMLQQQQQSQQSQQQRKNQNKSKMQQQQNNQKPREEQQPISQRFEQAKGDSLEPMAATSPPKAKATEEPQNKIQDSKSPSEGASSAVRKLARLKLAAAAAAATPKPRGVLLPGDFPPLNARVRISASLASGVIFIYHNNAAKCDYIMLANRVHECSLGAIRALAEPPRVDDVIFAPFQGALYRGKVLSVKGGTSDQITVQYPDFGNVETLSWKQAKEIPDEDVKWARYLTHPVRLEGVAGKLTEEMKNALEFLEQSEDFELVKVTEVDGGSGGSDSLPEVVLKQIKGTLTLNMHLMELREKTLRAQQQAEKNSSPTKSPSAADDGVGKQRKEFTLPDPNSYVPLLYDDAIEHKLLPVGSKQRVLIIDASDVHETKLISVIAAAHAEPYGAVLEACERCGVADPNVYSPTKEDEVCLVRYNNEWSRAWFYKTDDRFLLLDIGILVSVAPDNVRRFPPSLSRIIYNNEVNVDDECYAELKKLMTNGEPDSLQGKTIDVWVSEGKDGHVIRLAK